MSSVAIHIQPDTKQNSRFKSGLMKDDNNPRISIPISKSLHYTTVISFILFIILLTSFASPYWLSSGEFSSSTFDKLGLWDICFRNYDYLSYEYRHSRYLKLAGCHYIYSQTFEYIRETILPSWFIVVQSMITTALCLDALGLMAISILFNQSFMKYQLVVLSSTTICHLFTTLFLAFGLLIFYLKAFDRYIWMNSPGSNELDWAYKFALVAMAGNGVITILYYRELIIYKLKFLNYTTSRIEINDDDNSQQTTTPRAQKRVPFMYPYLNSQVSTSIN